MNIYEYVNLVIKKIIICLQSDKQYEFSENEIKYLNNYLNPDIRVLEMIKEKNLNMRCLNDPNLMLKFDILAKKPQVIDPIPVLRNGSVFRFLPAIIVPENFDTIEEKWVILHEICHLLSIGDYIIDYEVGIYRHSFGINQYYYNSYFEPINSITDNRLNEIINDAVTWHFMEELYDCPVYPTNSYIQFHCKSIKEMKMFKRLIRYYFGNMGQKIIDLLKELK